MAPPSNEGDRSAKSAKGPSEALHKSVREVYCDDVLWILNKPAGVVSHPNPPAKRASNALLRGTYDFEQECYEFEGDRRLKVWLVHRLDQDTSGLIMCTFSGEAAAQLKEGLYHREVEKEYRALLLAAPRPAFGEWNDKLVRDSRKGKVEVRASSSAKPNAETSYELEREFVGTGLALVRLRPHTGKTHQLRVQTAKRGIPIAGDERYGDFTANKFLRERAGLKYMFLHAARLSLRHPQTGKRLQFTAELGQRLELPLAELDKLQTRLPRRKESEEAPYRPGKRAKLAQKAAKKSKKSKKGARGGSRRGRKRPR